MPDGEVHDVDVVPDPGPVHGLVVAAVNHQLVAAADCNLFYKFRLNILNLTKMNRTVVESPGGPWVFQLKLPPPSPVFIFETGGEADYVVLI